MIAEQGIGPSNDEDASNVASQDILGDVEANLPQLKRIATFLLSKKESFEVQLVK